MKLTFPGIQPIITTLLFAAGITVLHATPIHAQVLETEITTTQDEASPSATESATPSASPTQTSTVTSVDTRDINGEVIKTGSNQITVESGDETTEIGLSSNIRITRDGKDVEPSAIQVGDNVKATVDSTSNQAISIEATSNQVAGMQQWLMPVIIGALLLGGLLYYLMRRANRQKIKTTTTNL